jgi:cysteine desulfurase/selenocysteine lyase
MALAQLLQIPGLTIIGTAPEKTGVISFTINKIHPHDIGTILDKYGIAVRTGHHCTMPVMEFLQLPATVRVSLGMYNTHKEIDTLCVALLQVLAVFDRL